MQSWIRLSRFTVPCVVGVLEREQRATQPVEVDLRLSMGDWVVCAETGDLSLSVDYAAVAEQVSFLLQHGQWRLLEAATQAIARLLLAPPAPAEGRAAVLAVRVELSKPAVMSEVACPSVGIERDAAWCELSPTLHSEGLWVELLQRTPLVGAYRQHLQAGARFVHPAHASSLVVAGRFATADGAVFQPGDRLARGQELALQNPDEQAATLLTVSRPPLAS